MIGGEDKVDSIGAAIELRKEGIVTPDPMTGDWTAYKKLQ